MANPQEERVKAVFKKFAKTRKIKVSMREKEREAQISLAGDSYWAAAVEASGFWESIARTTRTTDPSQSP
jgi:hypothetical protein